mmetsp:Transcript_17351/g.50436  ORF Transcript_17351/g.50436 Transcript_17351/m.50436 type:complete len:334 (-) Transcript_17351:717-1718(-)
MPSSSLHPARAQSCGAETGDVRVPWSSDSVSMRDGGVPAAAHPARFPSTLCDGHRLRGAADPAPHASSAAAALRRLRFFLPLAALSRMLAACFLSVSRSTTSSSMSSSKSSSSCTSSSRSVGSLMRMLPGPRSSSAGTAPFLGGATTACAASMASSSKSIASRSVVARASMSSSSAIRSLAVTCSMGISCSSLSASSWRAMFSTPARTFWKTDFMCSCLLRMRSYLLCASLTPSPPVRALGLRDAPGLEEVYLRRCTCSSARRFCSCRASMRAWESLVICCRCLWVSSWVRNFSMTSLTSDTPVTSLIFWKAASYARMFFCSSSMDVSLRRWR